MHNKISARTVDPYVGVSHPSRLHEGVVDIVAQEPTWLKNACLRPHVRVGLSSVIGTLGLEVEVVDMRVLSVGPLGAVRQARQNQAFQRCYLGSSIDSINQLLIFNACGPQVQRLTLSRL